MGKCKVRVIIVSILALLIFITGCTKGKEELDNGLDYTLKSEELQGKMKELHSILAKNVTFTKTARVEDFDMELSKDMNDTIIYGTLQTNNGRKIEINYFDSQKTGTIHTEEIKDQNLEEHLSWEQFLDVLEAFKMNQIVGYNADSIEIQYPFEPFSVSKIEFTEEGRKRTYDYSHIEDVQPKEGNNGQLGYYLCDGDSCIPVENMSTMDGSYYCIKVSFYDSKTKESTGSYSVKGWFGILVEI